MEKKIYPTNYKAAVNWLPANLILYNNLSEESTELLYDNWTDEELMELEIYQWYLTDFSDEDVEFLQKHFNLKFAWNYDMQLWILCVTHYGTAWDYVYWTTDLEQASCGLGEEPRPF